MGSTVCRIKIKNGDTKGQTSGISMPRHCKLDHVTCDKPNYSFPAVLIVPAVHTSQGG